MLLESLEPKLLPGRETMAAYVIAEVDVKKPERFDEYRRQVGPTLERYGGRFLARGGQSWVLEGAWKPKRLVILEFESAEKARQWWSSPEYEGPKKLRQSLAETNLILLEGLESR